MFSIKRMEKADISQCVAIYNQNYPNSPYKSTINTRLQEMFTVSFNRSKPVYITLKMGNTVVAFGGYAESQFCTGTYELFLINVKTQFQGKGFGNKLVLELLLDYEKNFHKEKEESWIILNCKRDLIKFYQQFGFRAVDSRRDGQQYLMTLNTRYITRDLTAFINNRLKSEAAVHTEKGKELFEHYSWQQQNS